MLNNFYQFFAMQGYGVYIWPAYGIVLTLLVAQWWGPWRRWKRYLRTNTFHE